MGVSCCEGCVRARYKLEHPELIECKLRDVPADRSDFLNSGFGRAIEMGAGFGIGDDLINKLF
jgi:hypothetical protein